MSVENLSFEERLKSCDKSNLRGRKTKPETVMKRANKNRPREVSSKLKPRMEIAKRPTESNKGRDPRFDSLCGEFDDKAFKDDYSFVDVIKKKEEYRLRGHLKFEEDPDRKKQILELLKKSKNRHIEKQKLDNKKKKEIEHVQKVRQSLIEGKPARFRNKVEKQVSDLVDQFEELKSKGKVEKYLKKKSKKLKLKEKLENAGFQ